MLLDLAHKVFTVREVEMETLIELDPEYRATEFPDRL
jgi:hypothetical protein